jgi:hypothetical protein
MRASRDRGTRVGLGGSRWLVWLIGPAIFTVFFVARPVQSQEICQQKKSHDPRASKLQIVHVKVGKETIQGKIKSNALFTETAIGVTVWVNYHDAPKRSPFAQQCIPIGNLKAGEEREFSATPISESQRAKGYTTTVNVVTWEK